MAMPIRPSALILLLMGGIPALAQPPAAAPPTLPPDMTSQAGTTPTGPPTEIQGESMDVWIGKLSSKDPQIRELALRVVPLFGEKAKKAVPKMIELMRDSDYSVKLTALMILTLNPLDEEKHRVEVTRRILDGFLRHPQAALRVAGAQAAGRMGTLAAGAINDLVSDLHIRNGASYEARKVAAEALGRIAGRDPKNPESAPSWAAISALLNALGDPALVVRIEAAQSLIYLGPPGTPDLLEKEKEILLRRIVAESDRALAIWLRVCYMRLDPEQINSKNLEPIAAALRSGEHRVRINAADALAVMGPGARDRAGDLREGFRYANSDKPEDLDFLLRCLWAIGNIGKDASFLLAELKEMAANHKDPTVKAAAQEAADRVQGKMNPMTGAPTAK